MLPYLPQSSLTRITLFFKISFLLILSILLACEPAQKHIFDKNEMIANITEYVILANYQSFAMSAAEFYEQTLSFKKENTAENLYALQAKWEEMYGLWKKCEFANFGLAKEKNFMYDINFNELRTKLIMNVLSSKQEINDKYIQSLGSAAKGLPAIGFLLFDKGKMLTDKKVNQRILSYLEMLAKHLEDKSQALYDEWKNDYQKKFLKNEDNNSVNTLANQLLALTENLASKRIDKLAKQLEDSSRLSQYERVANKKEFIMASLEVIDEAFKGNKGIGFDDYLDNLGAKFTNHSLSSKIKEQIENTQIAVSYINNEEKATQASEEIKKLLILIRTDMFSALSINVSFTDADGD
ncbi:imelysin family protein [Thermoflexibacter ruber]|uniref:Predicted lipoprotein n=1 Tax=Thermoflexibacter ruber TaxID=1003 RepID=A0A1I2B9J2_9BACT|nr:imelysin family protein [Thermoflexibacter ruber]SFE52834.1 Predicted lipoprotein [Thermoflexibacter ruber]